MLQKYAGADDPSRFNWSLTAGFFITSEFAEYLDINREKLFGNVKVGCRGTPYYELCMYCYYNEHFHNKAMFKLNYNFLKKASNEIPTPQDVMAWFYKKHKDELVGLV